MRSLASRGQLGGLSVAVPASLRVLAAAGWPNVIVETVGVGQSEVAIAGAADTTLVVVNPGWGDEVQANKAGLLEIADILVVNKGDRPGVESTVRDLQRMLHLGKARAWNPVVVVTTATNGDGVDLLRRTIIEHREFLHTSGELAQRRTQRRLTEARERLAVDLQAAIDSVERSTAGLAILSALERGELDPVSAGHRLLELAAEFTSG
jgi:LAO/AO transport system kinase